MKAMYQSNSKLKEVNLKESVLTFENGKIGFVYNEDMSFLMDLGKTVIKRLSNVNFNNKSHMWEVKFRGNVLAQHKTRSKAINWEINYFNNEIMKGRLKGVSSK